MTLWSFCFAVTHPTWWWRTRLSTWHSAWSILLNSLDSDNARSHGPGQGSSASRCHLLIIYLSATLNGLFLQLILELMYLWEFIISCTWTRGKPVTSNKSDANTMSRFTRLHDSYKLLREQDRSLPNYRGTTMIMKKRWHYEIRRCLWHPGTPFSSRLPAWGASLTRRAIRLSELFQNDQTTVTL